MSSQQSKLLTIECDILSLLASTGVLLPPKVFKNIIIQGNCEHDLTGPVRVGGRVSTQLTTFMAGKGKPRPGGVARETRWRGTSLQAEAVTDSNQSKRFVETKTAVTSGCPNVVFTAFRGNLQGVGSDLGVYPAAPRDPYSSP